MEDLPQRDARYTRRDAERARLSLSFAGAASNQEEDMSRLCLVVVVIPLLAGWTYPQEGSNIPCEGKSHDYIWDNRCATSTDVDCFRMQNQGWAYVPIWVYEGDTGPIYNPLFITRYGWKLVGDNRDPPAQNPNCTDQHDFSFYLSAQLGWLDGNRESPHTGLDIWRYYFPGVTAYPDGMTQAEVAWLYHLMYQDTFSLSYYTKSNRAGKAFDWSWTNSGVAHAYDSTHYWYMHVVNEQEAPRFVLNAHNIAVSYLYELCDFYGGTWCTRQNRGAAVVREESGSRVDVTDFDCPADVCSEDPYEWPEQWSYYRVAGGQQGGEDTPASCNYHRENFETLYSLVDKNLDVNAVLFGRAYEYETSYFQARLEQKCCDEDADCPTGMECGGLHECKAAQAPFHGNRPTARSQGTQFVDGEGTSLNSGGPHHGLMSDTELTGSGCSTRSRSGWFPVIALVMLVLHRRRSVR